MSPAPLHLECTLDKEVDFSQVLDFDFYAFIRFRCIIMANRSMLMLSLRIIQIKLWEKFEFQVRFDWLIWNSDRFQQKKACLVVQNAEICLYSSTQYKCDVAALESR